MGVTHAEIHKTLIKHKAHATLLAPLCQLMDTLQRNEIARGIVGIDEKKGFDRVRAKEFDHVGCAITKRLVLRNECYHLLSRQAVGIFLKRGAHHAYLSIEVLR